MRLIGGSVLLIALFGQHSDGNCLSDLEMQVADLKAAVDELSRELMVQEYRLDEAARSSGSSGLKTIKAGLVKGTKAYYATSYVGTAVAAIHDHGNNIRTLGMGELSVVLNGVEFRTRHNDYRMVMKSTTSSSLGATEDIAFPEVPPEVLSQPTVEAEIAEMREWFKAWAAADHGLRDYRPYFKPTLCYLEGAWFQTTPDDVIEEPFFSDRHSLNTATWREMEEFNRFCAMTGRQDENEGSAFLPRRLLGRAENGTLLTAQWHYQILCHPLSMELPRNRLRLVDDLKSRMRESFVLRRDASLADLEASRAARFQMNVVNISYFVEDGSKRYSFLDALMEEIPGLDSYGATHRDDALGYPTEDFLDGGDLNAAYYHRFFKVDNVGAMGTMTRNRAFNDPNLYMAMNSQPRVASATFGSWSQKWSFAIPLEIVYLTPLSRWNPYGIEYKGNAESSAAATVTHGPSGQRIGASDPDHAYNGTHSKLYYLTPAEFYSSAANTSLAPEDTTGESLYVLDSQGTVRQVLATGMQIHLPDIPGVSGRIRQRYPIMPIHQEGSATWMELEALKDIAMEPERYRKMSREYVPDPDAAAAVECTTYPEPLSAINEEDAFAKFIEDQMLSGVFTAVSLYMVPNADAVSHHHVIELSARDMESLCVGDTVTMTTSVADGHAHVVDIKKTPFPIVNTVYIRLKYVTAICDGMSDCVTVTGHNRRLLFLLP